MRIESFPTRLPAGLLLVACWLASGPASAQVIYNNASTVGESYAKGLSDVISAQGNYNLATSEATINLEEAARRDIENRQKYTETYFEMRKINRAARAAEKLPPLSMEAAVRVAQAGKPKRLNPSEFDYVTGQINWPAPLKQKQYDAERAQLDDLFEKRAQFGGLSFDDQTALRQSSNAILDGLKSQVRSIPGSAYMAGKHFIESLVYESQLPPNG